jgi:hypothetical protein
MGVTFSQPGQVIDEKAQSSKLDWFDETILGYEASSTSTYIVFRKKIFFKCFAMDSLIRRLDKNFQRLVHKRLPGH